LLTRITALDTQLKSAKRDTATAAQQAQAARQAFENGNIDARTLTDYESTVLSRSQTVFDLRRALDEAHIGLDLELGLGLPQTRIAPLDTTELS